MSTAYYPAACDPRGYQILYTWLSGPTVSNIKEITDRMLRPATITLGKVEAYMRLLSIGALVLAV